jgi:hypothetical protein
MSPLFGPDPQRILERGDPVEGNLVGIEVKTTHDDNAVRFEEYAIEDRGTTYGIRQALPASTHVRLGMALPLRVDGTNAVIALDGAGVERWKMLRNPPAPGIVDDHDDNDNRGALAKARRGDRKVAATVLELQTRSVAFGMGSTVDARMRIDPAAGEPYEITVQNVSRVPRYASHLPVVGAVLPGWEVRGLMGGERVMIDWPEAAMADPGVGQPPADMPEGTGMASGKESAVSTMGSSSADAPWNPDEAEAEIPDYAKNLMKKFGVDPESLK